MRSFTAETPDGLLGHFVPLTEIGTVFMSEIVPRLHFGFYYREGCGFLRPSVSQVSEILRRFGFVLRSNLVYDFISVNSIFHLLVPQRGYFSLHCSPLFILSCLRPTSRAAVEETAALNSGYSFYASAVHTRSRKMDKTLSVKVFLMSFSTRDSHFYRWDILVPWYFTFFMPHQFFKT